MSINKDINNKNHDKYIKEDKFLDKDICDEIHVEDDKLIDEDIYDEYIEKDKIYNKFPKDTDKKVKDYSQPDDSNIYVNCKLKVEFDTKNKMIYLYPGKSQFYTVDVSKCCGDVIIKYKGRYPKTGICGNLGIYKIVQSGIVVETYSKLDSRKKDILYFTAIDKCTKECYDFAVVFSCNSCGCYY